MADSWNWPALINKIAQDVPFLQRALNALLKQDPTSIEDAPSGAKRLFEVSSGKWQWQEYNGSSWAAVPFLQHNVDQLDGYHAAITPAANTVAVRNASGLLEDSIAGNAATASSAATLSQTLPVNKGGTGATTSEAARENLGVPPTSHASTATAYGVANASQYGHVKLSDAANSSSSVTGGVAATPAAVKAAKDAADAAQSSANSAQSSANAAMTKASTIATASAPGIVKPGTGMTVDAAGALKVSLNNTVTSTSTTQAATANAVKTAYDKAEEAASKVDVANVMSAVSQVQSEVEGVKDDLEAIKISGKKVAKKGTRTTSGDWSITSLVVGIPLYILVNIKSGTGLDYGIISGADGNKTSGYNAFFQLGNQTNYAAGGTIVTIPTSTIVVIRINSLNCELVAYQ